MTLQVQIILGSGSDLPVAEKAVKILRELGLEYQVTVASAHRTPARVEEIVKNCDAGVFVAIAGLSAALPGVIAAMTIRPVIGVPVSGKLHLDSLLSVVQMPPGIPVLAVGLDRGDNAALAAAAILALSDNNVAQRLTDYRSKLKEKVLADAKMVEVKTST